MGKDRFDQLFHHRLRLTVQQLAMVSNAVFPFVLVHLVYGLYFPKIGCAETQFSNFTVHLLLLPG